MSGYDTAGKHASFLDHAEFGKEYGSTLSTIRNLSKYLCFVNTSNVSTYGTLTVFEAILRGATTKKTI